MQWIPLNSVPPVIPAKVLTRKQTWPHVPDTKERLVSRLLPQAHNSPISRLDWSELAKLMAPLLSLPQNASRKPLQEADISSRQITGQLYGVLDRDTSILKKSIIRR